MDEIEEMAQGERTSGGHLWHEMKERQEEILTSLNTNEESDSIILLAQTSSYNFKYYSNFQI